MTKLTQYTSGVVLAILIAQPTIFAQLTTQPASRPASQAQAYLVSSVTVDPLAGLDRVIQDMQESFTENHAAKLAQFETELRTRLREGWVPPWQELEVRLTREQVAITPTEELAVMCFASGIPARTIGLYNDPHYGIKRLEVLNAAYAELFARADAWKGLMASIDFYLDQMTMPRTRLDSVNASTGLSFTPSIYTYPPIRKQIVGHEQEIIVHHITALKRINHLAARAPGESQGYFAVLAPVSLAQYALVLGRVVSKEQFESSRQILSRYRINRSNADVDVKVFVDQVVLELAKFLRKE